MNKLNTKIKINDIVRVHKRATIAPQEINTDSYLDYLETTCRDINWSKATWADRITVIWSLGDIALEFYKDMLDETTEDRKKALIELGTTAWGYIKQEFDIKMPFGLAMFEDQIVNLFITSSVNYAIKKLSRQNELPATT